MRFEEIYKSHRSAFIDGVFVGVAVAFVAKHAVKKLAEKYGQDQTPSTPMTD